MSTDHPVQQPYQNTGQPVDTMAVLADLATQVADLTKTVAAQQDTIERLLAHAGLAPAARVPGAR